MADLELEEWDSMDKTFMLHRPISVFYEKGAFLGLIKSRDIPLMIIYLKFTVGMSQVCIHVSFALLVYVIK